MSKFKSLGQRVDEFIGFDTFETPENVTRVQMTSDEVTAVCPVTGQPDWYTVVIEYVPDGKCIESKSLKMYLQSFRQDGIFCEALAGRICQEVAEAIKPVRVVVTIKQKARGGVSIEVTAEVRGSVTWD